GRCFRPGLLRYGMPSAFFYQRGKLVRSQIFSAIPWIDLTGSEKYQRWDKPWPNSVHPGKTALCCTGAGRVKEDTMAYDLLIKNAKICDGTGAPAYGGAVAVSGGQIAATGKVSGTARREINADGLVLAPGFIDIHTHYDAQISWDPLL